MRSTGGGRKPRPSPLPPASSLVPWTTARVPLEWLAPAPAQVVLALVSVTAAVVALMAARRPAPGRVAAALGGGTAAVFLVLVAWFLPAFRRAQPNGPLTADVVRERTVPAGRRGRVVQRSRPRAARPALRRADRGGGALRSLGPGRVLASVPAHPRARGDAVALLPQLRADRELSRAARDRAHLRRSRRRGGAAAAGAGGQLRHRRPGRGDQEEEGPEAALRDEEAAGN